MFDCGPGRTFIMMSLCFCLFGYIEFSHLKHCWDIISENQTSVGWWEFLKVTYQMLFSSRAKQNRFPGAQSHWVWNNSRDVQPLRRNALFLVYPDGISPASTGDCCSCLFTVHHRKKCGCVFSVRHFRQGNIWLALHWFYLQLSDFHGTS